MDQAKGARDAEVEDVLSEFGGDYRAAIAALLSDIDVLARDREVKRLAWLHERCDPASRSQRMRKAWQARKRVSGRNLGSNWASYSGPGALRFPRD